MINEFVVTASNISPCIGRKMRRKCFILWVVLKTSIMSPPSCLYFRVGKFKGISLSLYNFTTSLIEIYDKTACHENPNVSPRTGWTTVRKLGSEENMCGPNLYIKACIWNNRKGDELRCNGPCCMCESFFFFLMGVSGWMFLPVRTGSSPGSAGQRMPPAMVGGQ